MIDGLQELQKIEEMVRNLKAKTSGDPFIHLHERLPFIGVEKCLKAAAIIINLFDLKISTDSKGNHYVVITGESFRKMLPIDNDTFDILGLVYLEKEEFYRQHDLGNKENKDEKR